MRGDTWIHGSVSGSMLVQRRRRWTNIDSASDPCIRKWWSLDRVENRKCLIVLLFRLLARGQEKDMSQCKLDAFYSDKESGITAEWRTISQLNCAKVFLWTTLSHSAWHWTWLKVFVLPPEGALIFDSVRLKGFLFPGHSAPMCLCINT